MRVLVVHYSSFRLERKTVHDHLYSFGRYLDAEVIYLNAYFDPPKSLSTLKPDLIIYHYSALALRWLGPKVFNAFMERFQALADCQATQVAIPQDEYIYCDLIEEFLNRFSVNHVFTCLPGSEYEKVYPRSTMRGVHFTTVLTGYLDDQEVAGISPTDLKSFRHRTIDVGYRARRLPYWLGRQGQIKTWLATDFTEHAQKSKQLLTLDISLDPNDVFLGESWLRFLGDCRYVLGSEGGSSLLDFDGTLKSAIDTYCLANPSASFAEVEEKFFIGRDGELNLKAISPRNFEAVLTGTAQILVEGDYNGIFKAYEHYIPLKPDFSNFDEVLQSVLDHQVGEKIAASARALLEEEGLKYSSFALRVVETSMGLGSVVKRKGFKKEFKPQEFYPSLGDRTKFLLYSKAYSLGDKTGMLKHYRKVRNYLERKRLL